MASKSSSLTPAVQALVADVDDRASVAVADFLDANESSQATYLKLDDMHREALQALAEAGSVAPKDSGAAGGGAEALKEAASAQAALHAQKLLKNLFKRAHKNVRAGRPVQRQERPRASSPVNLRPVNNADDAWLQPQQLSRDEVLAAMRRRGATPPGVMAELVLSPASALRANGLNPAKVNDVVSVRATSLAKWAQTDAEIAAFVTGKTCASRGIHELRELQRMAASALSAVDPLPTREELGVIADFHRRPPTRTPPERRGPYFVGGGKFFAHARFHKRQLKRNFPAFFSVTVSNGWFLHLPLDMGPFVGGEAARAGVAREYHNDAPWKILGANAKAQLEAAIGGTLWPVARTFFGAGVDVELQAPLVQVDQQRLDVVFVDRKFGNKMHPDRCDLLVKFEPGHCTFA